ncbi:MAG: glycerophosphodiester phosphodiesterase [Actinomycetota bacterium]|jgi:glycerophosphoryl diester phosphodiesterase
MSKSNPWLDRRVVAFAHQGGAFEGPSSTLFAIEQAIARGATAIELDVHATKDRHIVVCHDETVDRTTNHVGEICNFTLAELQEMDNAYWWIEGAATTPDRAEGDYPLRGRAPSDRRFGIATLEEVATAFPRVPLNMDIKRTSPEVEPYEELLAKELRRLERTASVIVASFSDDAIGAFRCVAPEVLTSAATNETAAFYFAVREGSVPTPLPVCSLQVPASYGDIVIVDEAFVTAAHGAGIAVHVWTINDRPEMQRLLDLDVDGLISDTPTTLVNLLEERGVAWDGVL